MSLRFTLEETTPPPVTSTLTHTTDACIVSVVTKTHTTDAVILKESTKTHTTDAIAKAEGTTRDHTTDAVIVPAGVTIAHTTDASLKTSPLLTHTSDVKVIIISTQTHTVDAIIKALGVTTTHTTDALNVALRTQTHTTDVIKLKTLTLTHTTDFIKFRTVALSHTTDAKTVFARTRSHTTDAYVRGVPSVSHTTDAKLTVTGLASHTTDAIVSQVSYEQTHTTDAILGHPPLRHTTDALVAPADLRTLTGVVDVTSGLDTVTGTGTLFLTQVSAGQQIVVAGEAQTVLAVTDNLNLTTVSTFAGTQTAVPYQVLFASQIPPQLGFTHEIRDQSGALLRQLPEFGSPLVSAIGEFQDQWEFGGGPSAASGVISLDELANNPTAWQRGNRWLVKDETTGEYIFAGDLKKPVDTGDKVVIAADGWGKVPDTDQRRLLFESLNLDMWSMADDHPISYEDSSPEKLNSGNIFVKNHGGKISFIIPRHSAFIRNKNTGLPTAWYNGAYFWVPETELHRVAADIHKHHNDDKYDMQVVAAHGPAGTLNVIATFSMGAAGPDLFDVSIPTGYDLVGVRLKRTDRALHTVHERRFWLENLRVGSIATTDDFFLSDGMRYLLTAMGATATTVPDSTTLMLPYDVDSTPSEAADDLAVLGPWTWRMDADSSGAKVGVAGPVGERVWYVDLEHSPVDFLPQEVFNGVRYNYNIEGGHVLWATVMATTNPFPTGYDRIYRLELDSPGPQTIATEFAQNVADYLTAETVTGSCILALVSTSPGGTPAPATLVKPGDQLIFTQHSDTAVYVSTIKHRQDGSLIDVEFTSGNPLLDRLLAERKRLLNMGLTGAKASLILLGIEDPLDPTGSVVTFIEILRHNGKYSYHAVFEWDPVDFDIDGNPTAIKRYNVKARPLERVDVSTWEPVSKDDGGGWRRNFVREPKDDEDPEFDPPTRWVLRELDHPHRWKWEFWVQAEDILGQLSVGVSTITDKPAGDVPPHLENCLVKRGANGIVFLYTVPREFLAITGRGTGSGSSLTGRGTSFLSDVVPGDLIRVGTDERRVSAVSDDAHLTIASSWSGSFSTAKIFVEKAAESVRWTVSQIATTKNFDTATIVEEHRKGHGHRTTFSTEDSDQEYFVRGRTEDVEGDKAVWVNAVKRTTNPDGNSDPATPPDAIKPKNVGKICEFSIDTATAQLYGKRWRAPHDYKIKRITGTANSQTSAAIFDIKKNGSHSIFANTSDMLHITGGDGSTKAIEDNLLDDGDYIQVRCEQTGGAIDVVIHVILERMPD